MVGDALAGDIAAVAMTQTGTLMGTPLYMSPEQACGRVSEIGPPTDVWAIGLIVLQLLTGEGYWRAKTVAELMANIIAQPMDRPTERWPWLPPAMDAWFARSCARPVADRFRSVGEQIDALAEALGDVDAVSGPTRASAATPENVQHTLEAPPDAYAEGLERESVRAATRGASSTTSPAALSSGARSPSRRTGWVVAAALVAAASGAYAWAEHAGPAPWTSRSGSLGSPTATAAAGGSERLAEGGDSSSGSTSAAYETERAAATAPFDRDDARPASTGTSTRSSEGSSSRAAPPPPAASSTVRRRLATYAPLTP